MTPAERFSSPGIQALPFKSLAWKADRIVRREMAEEGVSAMNVNLIAIPLLIPVAWNIYTTFLGLSDIFDLPTNPNINPGQFTFAAIVTLLVFLFVLATQLIWNFKEDDTLVLLLKAAAIICIAFDVFASWHGTKQLISFDDGDPGKAVGLAFVVVLTVLAKLSLSMILFRE